MLDTQYRMHPGISRFPSSEFYDFALLDGTVNTSGQVRQGLLPPVSSHLALNPQTGHRPSLIFIDHQGPEAVKNRSRVNWTEGYIACSIIEDLLLKNAVRSPLYLSNRHAYLYSPRASEEKISASSHRTSPKYP